MEEVRGKKEVVDGKITSTWARLIHRISKVDPLRCRGCGGQMKINSFITDADETRKILKHIGEETTRSPPLKPLFSTAGDHGSYFADYIPTGDEYIRNAEYIN